MNTPDREQSHRILYVSYDGLTDGLGQSQILPYLTGLAKEGYSITIISFEKPDRFKKYQDQILKICELHQLYWKPLIYHKSPLIFSTLYDLMILRIVVKKLFLEKPFAIIHCRSYLTSLIGHWLKQKFGVKFIFDMRGFWADERVDGGIWNLNNPLFRMMYLFFKRKEREFLKAADHVICLTENARLEILSWHHGQTPISVIPTCVDMELFHPAKYETESAVVRKALSIQPDTFVLIYLGSWGTWYMTDQILQFFSILVSKYNNAILLILTPDNPELKHYEFASKIIVKSVTRNEVPVYLTLGNASICFIKPAFSKKASSATKMAEAWAMNLPVVTNPGWGDIDRLNESGLPLFICENTIAYHNVATLLIDRKPQSSREMLLGNFDLASGIQKYKDIYQSLTV